MGSAFATRPSHAAPLELSCWSRLVPLGWRLGRKQQSNNCLLYSML